MSMHSACAHMTLWIFTERTSCAALKSWAAVAGCLRDHTSSQAGALQLSSWRPGCLSLLLHNDLRHPDGHLCPEASQSLSGQEECRLYSTWPLLSCSTTQRASTLAFLSMDLDERNGVRWEGPEGVLSPRLVEHEPQDKNTERNRTPLSPRSSVNSVRPSSSGVSQLLIKVNRSC